MGFETQEQAERWAENAEFAAKMRNEEKLLASANRLSPEYVATGLDACHKRIAELEHVLRAVRKNIEVMERMSTAPSPSIPYLAGAAFELIDKVLS